MIWNDEYMNAVITAFFKKNEASFGFCVHEDMKVLRADMLRLFKHCQYSGCVSRDPGYDSLTKMEDDWYNFYSRSRKISREQNENADIEDIARNGGLSIRDQHAIRNIKRTAADIKMLRDSLAYRFEGERVQPIIDANVKIAIEALDRAAKEVEGQKKC